MASDFTRSVEQGSVATIQPVLLKDPHRIRNTPETYQHRHQQQSNDSDAGNVGCLRALKPGLDQCYDRGVITLLFVLGPCFAVARSHYDIASCEPPVGLRSHALVLSSFRDMNPKCNN